MSDPQDRRSASTAPAAHTHVELTAPVERIWSEVSARHQDYLNAMADSHRAYLNTAAVLLGQAGSLPVGPAPTQSLPAPAPVATPQPVAPPPAPKANGSNGAHTFTPPPPAPAPAPAKPAAPRPAPQPAQVAKAVAASPAMDAAAIVRVIVSDKTGYPPDMLDADMDLEGELGVDSIKQVEILSSLRDRLPHLPEIEPERLVELRTIAAIAAMIDAASPGGAPAPTVAAPMQAPVPAANGSTNGSVVSADVIRALIADKTGYPTDMLEDDMDLEGELGVDSIKQVEILSALRDQYPSLPEVDPEHLAELRTIGRSLIFA